jgi:hypothetical protein
MDKDERISFEKKMLPAFDQLKEKYGGVVYSLTPDFGNSGSNPNLQNMGPVADEARSHF